MKLNVKEILKPTLILVVICVVVTACLAVTNAATKDTIKARDAADAKASRQIALPGADSFEQSADEKTCYIGKKNGKEIGWVFTTSTASYGGDIKVMTGIDNDGKITGVVLVSTSDTPGLGLNAKKESFRNQYKQQVPDKGFEVVKSGNAGKGQINALTGATISSKAVTKAVNEAITEYNKVKGGD
jgi:electron transport complex protein RnfG